VRRPSAVSPRTVDGVWTELATVYAPAYFTNYPGWLGGELAGWIYRGVTVGYGRLTSPQHGWTYEGEWHMGQQNGRGRETMRNAHGVLIMMYEGEFRANKKHGRGRLEQLSDNLRSCTISEGEWRNGQLAEGSHWVGETATMASLLRLLPPPV
jgi:hypothetical protein